MQTLDPETILDIMHRRLKFAHFPYLRSAVKEMASVANSSRVAVLDVGCGDGNLGLFCRDVDSCDWSGLDLWDRQVRQAAAKGVYDRVYQINLLDGLPFRDNLFDALICGEVLMYLPNSQELLQEFSRVLKKRGRLFLYNPVTWMPKTSAAFKRIVRGFHQESRSVALDRQTNWREAERPCRITYYSVNSLVETVRGAGFRIEDVTAFRLFRNRLRLLRYFEDYTPYRRITQKVAGRFPSMATDVLVVGSKVD